MKWLATLLFLLSFTTYSQTPVYQYERFVYDGFPQVDSVPSGSSLGVHIYSTKYYQSVSGLQLFIMTSSETFNGASLQFFGPTCRNLNGFSVGLTSWTGRTNGLTLGTYNLSETCNGVTFGAIFNRTNQLNGISFGLANISDRVNGLTTGFALGVDQLNGLGIGGMSKVTSVNGLLVAGVTISNTNRGCSVGIVNVARVNKGLQIAVSNGLNSWFRWSKPNGPFFETDEPSLDEDYGLEDFDSVQTTRGYFRIRMLSPDSMDISQPFEPVDSLDMVRDGMTVGVTDMTKGYKYELVLYADLSQRTRPTTSPHGNRDVLPDQAINQGVMIGGMNESEINRGLQIGLYNDSKINRGLQIGLINLSSTGFFPLIKWW